MVQSILKYGLIGPFIFLLTFHAFGQNSVLNEGNWYKIGVSSQGIYKIDQSFLQEAGITTNTIDPRNFRIYGNGGGMLPQPNAAVRPSGLQENAIFVAGESDGNFDTEDYILFYGQSPDQLTLQSDGTPLYQKHLYSDTIYYFLTIADTPGLRVVEQENVSGNFPIITTYDELMSYEQDDEKVIISGREWYGERIASGQKEDITFEITHIKENSDIEITLNVLNRAQAKASFVVGINNTQLGQIDLDAVADGTYTPKGKEAHKQFITNSNSITLNQDLKVNLQYSGSGIGHLNWILAKLQRELFLDSEQTVFQSLASLSNSFSTFSLENASQNITIWDITNPLRPRNQDFTLENSNARFSIDTQELRQFIAFQNSDFLQPVFEQVVANQNLRGSSVPELLIVTHSSLQSEADRLATFRTQHNGLQTLVVTTNQVFNEFSSGVQDVTSIRDFVKFLYDQNPEKLKYLLLLGKGTYDYKNKTDNNNNLVPTYESRNSLDPIYSFSSDDYFGFLEEEEGYWEESLAGESTLEIGVGRLPVKNLQEATAVVNKIIRYETSPETLGKWRNSVYFVADDGDGDRHQKDADFLATMVDTAHTDFNVQKIYLDAFPQQSQASGEISPQTNKTIDEAVEKGAFIINYTGHGGEVGWAEERILDLDMINRWTNKYQLPFFVTATCEFGRHDDPRRVSGAEQLVLNENNGAIGLVTTARPVFSSSNFKLNSAFYQKVLTKENGKYSTLGEIFRYTKNNGTADRVNRNFSLLGDPSMYLAYPENKIVLDSVEDLSSGIKTDTLKALSKIKLFGHVAEPGTGNIFSAFDGTIEVVVYDKPTVIQTLGNEGTTMQFEQRNSVIHRGQASVKNGRFTIAFVVPKNITYQKDFGKLSLYAWPSIKSVNLQDANGAATTLVIGGSNKNADSDNIPPLIKLFMDDESFVNKGIIGTDTRILAKFSDENGINVSQNGLGQNIVATLTNLTSQEVQEIILNDFYTTELDTFTSGKAIYPLSDLEEGNYSLEVKAWDTHNNAGTGYLEFEVVSENPLQISEFINYPNPVGDQTTFVVAHNRAGDDLLVNINIYNMQGEVIQNLNKEFMDSNARLDDMLWFGTNTTGHQLPPGFYVAEVIVKSLLDGAKNKKYRKIIIN